MIVALVALYLAVGALVAGSTRWEGAGPRWLAVVADVLVVILWPLLFALAIIRRS